MAYPAQLQQQPMQAPAPAYQQMLPRAAVQMVAPQRTAQLSVAPLGGNVGNVKTERAEARRTSFQVLSSHAARMHARSGALMPASEVRCCPPADAGCRCGCAQMGAIMM